MIVSAIVAMDRAGLIGDGEKMPWHLPRDLKRFRTLTWGKPVIMGRRTMESLHAPLAGRLNIVLTRNPLLKKEGFRIARSVGDALKIAEDHLATYGGQESMVIGGGQVYEATCHLWDRLLLTVVEGKFHGITRFPLERAQEFRWRLIRREFVGEAPKNPHPHWFLELERLADGSEGEQSFDLAGWLGENIGSPLGCC